LAAGFGAATFFGFSASLILFFSSSLLPYFPFTLFIFLRGSVTPWRIFARGYGAAGLT
jgi:hypothetical protein